MRDTGTLTLLEHGAYRVLLDHYYCEEELPAAKPRLYHLCRATEQNERDAVDFVVSKYFQIDGDRLRNRRADEEILERKEFIEEQRRKGKLGGRPKRKAAALPKPKPNESLPSPSPSPSLTPTPESNKTTPLSSPDDLLAAWNRICVSLPKGLRLTAKRIKHSKARLREYPFPEWEGIFAKIEGSEFCRGKGGTGWTATFDWIISSSDNAVKVLEGKYDGTNRNGKGRGTKETDKYKGIGESFEV